MNRRAAGFTLIELVLAISLFSVVLVVTYNAVNHAAKVRDAVQARGEILRAANAFFARLDRELNAAYAYRLSERKGGGGQLGREVNFLGLNHDDIVPRDGLAFTCNCGEVWPFGLDDANQTPHMEVAYDFIYDTDADMTLLWRRQDVTMDDEPTAGGTSDTLWPVVRGMNLRYLDPVDKSWHDQWDAEATPRSPLPQAVEVTLWLARPDENEVEVDNPLILGKTIVLGQVRPRKDK